jgi:hypothetical protein
MKHSLPLVLGLLMAVPAVAQRSGMINQNAPSVSQTVTAGDAKITLDYTSIAWGQGRIFNAAMDKSGGGKARDSINNSAKQNPAGKFTTSVDLTCGDLKIPAGEYTFAFTINDNAEWQINFNGKETLTMKLPLQENKEMPHKRLLCSLFAGDDAGAGAYIAFGDKWCVLNFKPAGAGGGGNGKKG